MKIKLLLVIKQLMCSILDIKLSTKTSYKIFKLIKKIEEDEIFYNTKLQEILDRFGEKDKQGKFITDEKGNIKLNSKNVEGCRKAITELDNLEVECPNIIFTIDELEPLNLSVNNIILLQNFIEEEK